MNKKKIRDAKYKRWKVNLWTAHTKPESLETTVVSYIRIILYYLNVTNIIIVKVCVFMCLLLNDAKAAE